MQSHTSTFLSFAAGAVLFVAPVACAVNSGTNAADKPTDKLTELFGDEVIAKGKGVEVKRSQLDSALISIKSAAAARGQSISPEQEQMLERQQLQGLIQIQLLLNLATDADKAQAKEVAEKQFGLILKRAGSEEALNRQLKSVGMTEQELRTKITETAIAQSVLEREIKVTVTEGDAKKFYDETPARFEEPEMVRASHILFSTRDADTRLPLSDDKKAAKRKQAEDILKRTRAGEDFAKLAREFSEDPRVKENNGEYSFPRASADPHRAMVPEFESAAFSLNTNQISDIVTTQFGYHIIKLHEKIPARKEPFTGLETKTVIRGAGGTNITIRQVLEGQSFQKILPNYIEKLTKASNVEILDEKLKPKEVVPFTVEPAKTSKANEKKSEEKK